MSEIVESRREVPAIAEASSTQPEDKSAAGALETALAACEDDQDVQVAYFVYLITKIPCVCLAICEIASSPTF